MAWGRCKPMDSQPLGMCLFQALQILVLSHLQHSPFASGKEGALYPNLSAAVWRQQCRQGLYLEHGSSQVPSPADVASRSTLGSLSKRRYWRC